MENVTYNGSVVPPLLQMWFSQLLANQRILESGSASRHIDVTLTAGPHGAQAKQPHIQFK